MMLKLLYKITMPLLLFGAGYMVGSGNCQRYNVKVNEEKIVEDMAKEISPYIEIEERNYMNEKDNRKNMPEKGNEDKNVFKISPWKTLDEFF